MSTIVPNITVQSGMTLETYAVPNAQFYTWQSANLAQIMRQVMQECHTIVIIQPQEPATFVPNYSYDAYEPVRTAFACDRVTSLNERNAKSHQGFIPHRHDSDVVMNECTHSGDQGLRFFTDPEQVWSVLFQKAAELLRPHTFADGNFRQTSVELHCQRNHIGYYDAMAAIQSAVDFIEIPFLKEQRLIFSGTLLHAASTDLSTLPAKNLVTDWRVQPVKK